jgi:diaminopimelate epimerase
MPTSLKFYKYQGSGNDFILFDLRQQELALTTAQIAQLCHRRLGIGADGLMLLTHAPGYDFGMVYFNADGHLGSMCGNGGRCITRFAYDLGLHESNFTFMASDGVHQSSLTNRGWIRLSMQNVHQVDAFHHHAVLNTGSPHLVVAQPNAAGADVVKLGREWRNSPTFKSEGINVNFVEVLEPSKIFVRTYERGVEDETLSCGTGVTASALVNAHNQLGFNHIDVVTRGGELFVEFNRLADGNFTDIVLCGPATSVFSGTVAL